MLPLNSHLKKKLILKLPNLTYVVSFRYITTKNCILKLKSSVGKMWQPKMLGPTSPQASVSCKGLLFFSFPVFSVILAL